MKSSGSMSYVGSPAMVDKDEEMSQSVLTTFRVKEEELEKKKMDVTGRVDAH